ncbi:MAG TPA: hypothetical protein VGW38_00495 [Chloroflexota bacterium]|nr:hypothetical protein [Chloroflexota bacterium]
MPLGLISAQVDIFLHEGLVEEAIGELEESPDGFHHYSLVERVADAATHTHPEWVIHICQKRAELIMNAGKSQHYAHTAEWLRRARESASFSGRQSEWQDYISRLLQEHKRKHSLVPLLEQVKAGR